MKRALRGLMWVMLSTALVVMAPRAFAQRPPETHPVSEHRDIVMSWDRSAMPGDVELWAPRTLLAYASANTSLYGKAHLVCTSETDTSQGRCPTTGLEAGSSGDGEIHLQFTEVRSGMQTDVRLLGSHQRPMNENVCWLDFWDRGIRPLWAANRAICGRSESAGIGVHLSLLQHDLLRLVAGKWKARLLLKLHGTVGGAELTDHSFDFDFTITDRDAVAIYFPHFDEISPHVGMNLRYDPITQTVGGGTTVDMCLYDGLGSQAPYLGVTVRDSGGRAPGPSGFSAWHRDSGGTGDSERLDYNVTLDYNGAPLPMRNGVEEQLTGIDTSKLKLVVLPGMSQPVFCVDTPLRLEMPRVPIAEKQAGYYRGDLKVELRVPTGVP
ncbi:CfaE/CblD family pilus tip adhesin [Stenotrophomonas maltophilia]|uniref:CfaE/CblD family pilus tip adhesin n=1 Tax=Stenotrophomonas maltophilia TaxID=40324 RepID=UPI0015DE92A6|nr:CfaE/CblD family pilus tip adhesin [Stenotrophomonas maltophilia]MBA0449439.1 pilin protein [Stenotrophomonas maltophilia]